MSLKVSALEMLLETRQNNTEASARETARNLTSVALVARGPADHGRSKCCHAGLMKTGIAKPAQSCHCGLQSCVRRGALLSWLTAIM